MTAGSDFDEVAAKQDLADRYQQMLDSQLSAISNFDQKAWRVARLVGILLGIFFTGASIFVSKTSTQTEIDLLPVIATISVGVSALIVSVVFSALCILSTTAGFGLRVELSDALNNGELDVEDYPGIITKSYLKNIKNNIKVMKSKGRLLRYSLSALIIGIMGLSGGIFLQFVPVEPRFQYISLALLGAVSIFLGYYILTMQYSVLDTE